jgi:hypothetical protein
LWGHVTSSLSYATRGFSHWWPISPPSGSDADLAAARAEGRVGGRRKKLDAAKRQEIAESVKDLQQLEADVVDNVTAFYTYMKAMRDSLRKLAEIHPPPTGSHGGDDWHRAICNVIYMQFLGLESGRKAIKQLVEYESTQAEDTFTILLSELVAYAFLREQFKGDLRQRLLKAREEKYRQEVPDLDLTVKDKTGPKWERAKEVAAEVMKRHAEIFPEAMPLPTCTYRHSPEGDPPDEPRRGTRRCRTISLCPR